MRHGPILAGLSEGQGGKDQLPQRFVAKDLWPKDLWPDRNWYFEGKLPKDRARVQRFQRRAQSLQNG